ncbi:type IV toxin-antitoxin system AbiEi family antitoxin domain-containing protein [Rhodococcus sp. NPDC057529]|uniref:type IV toxin-antitoxin system AbiEi family antitoxin domain-containing protein n=1 Tax=Rhodococcus sp. NPDC057529 TaxID=3346158 RepID=UPI00366CBD35
MKSGLLGLFLSAGFRTVASMTPATIDFKPEFQRVLDHQHGLVTARQLRGLGITTRQIQHMVESGQWSAVLHGVYAVTNGPLDRPMMLWAALLFGGPRAILSHRTAAEEWALVRIDPEGPIHVTVPYGLSAEHQGPTYRKVGRRSDRLVPREGDLRSVALRDRRRGNAAELAGKATLVYGWEEVTRRSCEVAAQVRTVLERGGWSGSNPCPRCREYLLTAGG